MRLTETELELATRSNTRRTDTASGRILDVNRRRQIAKLLCATVIGTVFALYPGDSSAMHQAHTKVQTSFTQR